MLAAERIRTPGQDLVGACDGFDGEVVKARIAAFADQVERRLAGEITEDQFRPLRLMNGVYLQPHSYMLRIPLPYGMLTPRKLRALAHVARRYDKGYAHFTARREIRFDWPALADVPAILTGLAAVELQPAQASPGGIRIVAADHLAGAAADEIADPRPFTEILRRWSARHPELSGRPRQVRIAVTGSERDHGTASAYDIGLRLDRNDRRQLGFAVHVGGVPGASATLRGFLPADHLASYCTALLRVYDRHRQRPGKHRARLATLVHEAGAEAFAHEVEAEWADLKRTEPALPEATVETINARFAPPDLRARPESNEAVKLARLDSRFFGEWLARDTLAHHNPDYAVVVVPLGGASEASGDISAEQMETVAGLAARYGFDALRISPEQSLVLPHVARADLKAVYETLTAVGLAAARQDRGNHITDSRRHAGPQPIEETLHAREIRAA
ncbi:MAG: nitrite/sulfite reductase [Mesorhizobium sp.]|nr:nitrite/sulfite reductase [Mesorhizobium sp.]